MHRAAAALTLFSGHVLAHPGAEAHFHGVGIEHVLLFAVISAFLAFALGKK
jgi:hypothetical protein